MADAILLQGAGGGTGSDECTAGKAQVLEGYTAVTSDSDDEAAAGTMANQGAQTATLKAGGSYTIPEGYHNGGGSVKAEALSSQTSGDATAANILSGKTAWVNGSKVTGSMANNGDQSATLAAGGSKTIPAGYTSGGTVSAQSLAAQTSGTATAANILSGKTAWVNGSEVTGSMPDNSTTTSNGTVPGINSSYSSVPTRPVESGLLQYHTDTSGTARINMAPPKGYYPGGGGSYVNRPASEFGNATAADVVSGKTFTSASGLKVSGTIPKKLYSYYNKTTYGTTTVNDTKYICFNALDTGYYYNDSSNSSWAPELCVSEENFKTIARNTGLCVTPGDWEVFRDGAFQQSYIGIAPYYYTRGKTKFKESDLPGTTLTKTSTATPSSEILCGTSSDYGIPILSRYIPKAHVSKIDITAKLSREGYWGANARSVIAMIINSSKTITASYSASTNILYPGSDYYVNLSFSPESSWPDNFALGFYSCGGAAGNSHHIGGTNYNAYCTITSVTITLK